MNPPAQGRGGMEFVQFGVLAVGWDGPVELQQQLQRAGSAAQDGDVLELGGDEEVGLAVVGAAALRVGVVPVRLRHINVGLVGGEGVEAGEEVDDHLDMPEFDPPGVECSSHSRMQR